MTPDPRTPTLRRPATLTLPDLGTVTVAKNIGCWWTRRDGDAWRLADRETCRRIEAELANRRKGGGR